MKRTWITTLLVALVSAVPLTAHAQVVNGDFEAGALGWGAGPPPGWIVDFPAAGGNPNGHAYIRSPFGTSAGTACVTQVFQCGVPPTQGDCRIKLDYRLRSIDANLLSARVKILVDGATVFVSPPADEIPFTTIEFTVPCGQHQIALCLEVDPGNNGWEAAFDNVSAVCIPATPTLPKTWGVVKALYR